MSNSMGQDRELFSVSPHHGVNSICSKPGSRRKSQRRHHCPARHLNPRTVHALHGPGYIRRCSLIRKLRPSALPSQAIRL